MRVQVSQNFQLSKDFLHETDTTFFKSFNSTESEILLINIFFVYFEVTKEFFNEVFGIFFLNQLSSSRRPFNVSDLGRFINDACDARQLCQRFFNSTKTTHHR